MIELVQAVRWQADICRDINVVNRFISLGFNSEVSGELKLIKLHRFLLQLRDIFYQTSSDGMLGELTEMPLNSVFNKSKIAYSSGSP